MRKVNIQPRYISRFLPTAILFILTGFYAQADVVYAIPLKGNEHQMGNMLEWSTSFEQNSQTFIIEKSVDGTHFEKAGVIDAAGSTNEGKKYRFLDIGVNDKVLHYRLKQIDKDGTSSFSQKILVKKELSNQFMVVVMSSTVTNNTFDLTIDALNKVNLTYSLKNKQGELIAEAQQLLYTGLNDLQLSLKDEKEGVYFVELQVGQEKEMLVIQKTEDTGKKKTNFANKSLKKGG